MTTHRQRWENKGFCYTVHFSTPKYRFRECLCIATVWERRFSVFSGYFCSFALPYLQSLCKISSKIHFYQFLAISSAKMHKELVHPPTGDIKQA